MHLARVQASNQLSIKLLQCIVTMGEDNPETQAFGKLQLMESVTQLMPFGKPDFASVRYYPSVRQMQEKSGYEGLHKALFLLVKDFCDSMGFEKTLNELQQIEAASYLLDECDNFRLEDYVMMFALAKRGKLGVTLYNAINLDAIQRIYSAYWAMRSDAGEQLLQNQVLEDENRWLDRRIAPPQNDEEAQVSELFRQFAETMGNDFRIEQQAQREADEAAFQAKKQTAFEAFLLHFPHIAQRLSQEGFPVPSSTLHPPTNPPQTDNGNGNQAS
jgi:hypothetical protein